MCDQQCEIDELRRKMAVVMEDNRFLREQAQMQAAIIEKLDGKNAKLPSLMNSQMEEIRIYREQLRRLKEIFMRTNKARQEAELARQKAEDELQHLRGLAFEKHLPEREELLAAVSRLQGELDLQEKSTASLEKYIANLEKNQRCERNRLLRTQKELQFTVSKLSESVRELQLSLQEKQKVIDAQQMHMNRTAKHHTRSTAAGDNAELILTAPAERPSVLEGNPLGTAQSRRTPVSKAKEVSRPVTPKAEPVKTKEKPCPDRVKPRPRSALKRPQTSMGSVILATAKPEQKRPSSSAAAPRLKHVQFTNVDGKLVDITVPTGKDQDETYELLRANEKLARLVAEAKMHSEEANTLKPSSQPLIARASTIEEVSTKFSLPVTKLEITAKVTPPTLATQSSEEMKVLVKETPTVMSKARESKADSPAANSSTVSARGDLPEIVKNVINGSAYSSNDVPFATPSRPPALISNLIREMCYKELMEKQTLDPVTSPVPNARPVETLPAGSSSSNASPTETPRNPVRIKRSGLKRRAQLPARRLLETTSSAALRKSVTKQSMFSVKKSPKPVEKESPVTTVSIENRKSCEDIVSNGLSRGLASLHSPQARKGQLNGRPLQWISTCLPATQRPFIDIRPGTRTSVKM
ncbi:Lebercilin [Sparganum proliferum]